MLEQYSSFYCDNANIVILLNYASIIIYSNVVVINKYHKINLVKPTNMTSLTPWVSQCSVVYSVEYNTPTGNLERSWV